jgi:lanthanide-dependent methanol dehydrogenase
MGLWFCRSQDGILLASASTPFGRQPVVNLITALMGGIQLATDRRDYRMRILAIALGASLLSVWLLNAPSIAAESAAPPFRNSEDEEDGQWLMPAKDYANTRFSGLKQITSKNVGELKLAWKFSTGVHRGQEAAPIVVNDTMYVVTPFPNILYALDLNKPGEVKWKYEPKPEPAAQGVACCDVVNRGAFYAHGKLFFNTLDGNVCAVDAETGNEAWKTKLGNIHIGETMTMAPVVVGDHVLVGNSGGEYGVRGWITALNADSGEVAWKAYSTGLDKEVLIGKDFKPFYDHDKGEDLGVHTWPAEKWKLGGGNVWAWISYDPELDLIYHGTGNPGVWNPDLRPGDNKWTAGVFARDPKTGQARWFYQWSPHDLFDHDGVNENILVDLEIDGKQRKTLIHPERNGYVYVLDRTSGEVLSATPFVRVTSSKGVDLKTGRLIREPSKIPQTNKVVRDVAPMSAGAKDWQPASFSPRTKLVYIPHQTMAMDYEGIEASYIAGTPFIGVNEKMYPDPVEPGDGSMGALTAWDPTAKKQVWRIQEKFPVWSGTIATAGDVVFYGNLEGWFKAVDARSGKVLWKYKTSSGIIGQPVTFRGSDGKQYVAILSGVGGWAGLVVSGDLDIRDQAAGDGWGNAMRELPKYTGKGGDLYVFALP